MTATTEYFANNLAALRTHHPTIAAMIEQLPPDNEAALEHLGNDEYTVGTYYPHPSPLTYSQQLVEQLKFTNPRILIWLGFGLGYHLQQYAANPDLRNRLLVIVEPSPAMFRAALHACDWTDLLASKQIHWILGTDIAVLRKFFAQLFTTWPWLGFANAVEFVRFPPAEAQHALYLQQVQKALPEEIGHQYNRHVSDPFDSFIGVDNTLANLGTMLSMPVIDRAQGQFRGTAGIVIASGPSLAQALPALRAVQHDAILIACPSALPLLLREGIHPHIWLNIERGRAQGEFFANLPDYPPHVFIGPPLIHPLGWQKNRGHNVIVRGAGLLTNWLPLPGSQFDLGHSSAHTAFQLLDLLGCDPIYLVGQDLAYHDTASHADGTWQESARAVAELTKDGRRLQVPGNSGNDVTTNIFWWTFLKTFGDQLIPQRKGRVFNVIPHTMGAAIPGATRIDPERLSEHLHSTAPRVANAPALLEQLLAALPEATADEQAQRRDAWGNAIRASMDAIMQRHQECQRFALYCKQVLFRPEVGHNRWNVVQPVWQQFVADAEQFQMHFLNVRQQNRQHPYVTFLHPVVQGVLMRYLIEYYSHCTDLDGNFGEIQRKLELMHHLSKDEAHWAMQCYQRLAHTIKAPEPAPGQ